MASAARSGDTLIPALQQRTLLSLHAARSSVEVQRHYHSSNMRNDLLVCRYASGATVQILLFGYWSPLLWEVFADDSSLWQLVSCSAVLFNDMIGFLDVFFQDHGN